MIAEESTLYQLAFERPILALAEFIKQASLPLTTLTLTDISSPDNTDPNRHLFP